MADNFDLGGIPFWSGGWDVGQPTREARERCRSYGPVVGLLAGMT